VPPLCLFSVTPCITDWRVDDHVLRPRFLSKSFSDSAIAEQDFGSKYARRITPSLPSAHGSDTIAKPGIVIGGFAALIVIHIRPDAFVMNDVEMISNPGQIVLWLKSPSACSVE